jgi:hypothetical protein
VERINRINALRFKLSSPCPDGIIDQLMAGRQR